MSITVIASGTQSATLTTEHDLATDTASHVYVLGVDTGAMALADILEVRVYTKMLSGGTERLAYSATFSHVQGEPQKYSPPIVANISIRVSLLQSAGTGRSYPWALLALS
ncbi:hypothetical protein GCM10009555_017470 [Acrocarpospora macrocephala]|uniref:Uncharacterized protein n=1 Tax=Acrocarpospora macrocephala TaxID=150177 RepID=A0A5M3WEB6_9ACTN|nr:hypothetical protein [Acrocarpospora macrocephala]GES07407.1 hypothetical protein Amac_010020 [Acrocarpospora macrocephala]